MGWTEEFLRDNISNILRKNKSYLTIILMPRILTKPEAISKQKWDLSPKSDHAYLRYTEHKQPHDVLHDTSQRNQYNKILRKNQVERALEDL